MRLLPDHLLESSDIVANCRMNRERILTGTNSYTHDLKFNPLELLLERIESQGSASWLDLCCGTGNALVEAAQALKSNGLHSQLSIMGVDLVGMFNPTARDLPHLQLIEASLNNWQPDRKFDLITCVHGLHYIGDKLSLISRATNWLNHFGLFAAHLDLNNIQLENDPAPRKRILTEFRSHSLKYAPRRHLLTFHGPGSATFNWTYLGANDAAGPNVTGQPAVNSHYRI